MTLTETLMAVTVLALLSGVIVSAYAVAMRAWYRLSVQAQAFPSATVVLSSITNDLRNAAYVAIPTVPAAWVNGTGYTRGNRVMSNGSSYFCILGHTAAAAKAPGTTGGKTYWASDPGWVVIYHPTIDTSDSTRQAQRIFAVPITVDYTDVTRYYLSDSSGAANTIGTYLWRQEFSQTVAGTVQATHRRTIVARNVVNLTFTYSAASTGAGTRILAINAVALTMQGKEGLQHYESNFTSEEVFHNPALLTPVNVPTF
jgi:hypothetical protein